jgi:hypothetical protein
MAQVRAEYKRAMLRAYDLKLFQRSLAQIVERYIGDISLPPLVEGDAPRELIQEAENYLMP